MFCPVCKAEYRPGFTHCSDCDVDLVSHLPADVPTTAIPPENFGNPSLLWTGTSREAQSALCTALEAINIKYKQQETDVGIIPGLAQPVYGVFVQERDLDGAELVLERVAEHFEPSDSGTDGGDGATPQESPGEEPGRRRGWR